MKTREISHVAIYEMKMQSRGGVFRFFVLFSLVSIVACHAYWQGQGNCENWKMVALPCSMPLVNAYLFSVVQSLFLALLVSEIPVRLGRGGALDGIHARPVDNTTLFWGTIAGNLFLFLLQNAVVIIATVFIVNLTSLAGVGWKYYLFYLLTLNLPCWVFVAGLSLWVSGVFPSRYLSIAISVIWLAGCVFWLPYRFHGTLDYLGSGVPNLFSGITGHVNLPGYLLHRSIYFFTGLGFLFLGASRVRRLPNHAGTRGYYLRGGVLLVLVGFCCVLLLERGYKRDRDARAGYRASFERHWREETCRVRRHSITLEQAGERLKTRSDLSVYNPGSQRLERVVLFLNPGLRVTGLSLDGDAVDHERDGQVILIERGLDAGDSLRLRLEYEGKIDQRFCDLHLSDECYENSFYGDRFFARGRRGAFVSDDLLLLLPACVWYPVAFPPVNPLASVFTGKDFTRFNLSIVHPRQRLVYSQGIRIKTKDTVCFSPTRELKDISLCGGNYQEYSLNIDGIEVQLLSLGGYESLLNRFSKMNSKTLIKTLQQPLFQIENFKLFLSKRWCEPRSPRLCFFETPLAFRLESHGGKLEEGQVEPGMIFLPERGFDMDIADVMDDIIKGNGDLYSTCATLQANLRDRNNRVRNSHPLLGIRKSVDEEHYPNVYNFYSLLSNDDVWVFSPDYPFIGKVFGRLRGRQFWNTGKSLGYNKSNREYDYLTGRTLSEVFANDSLDEAFLSRVFDLAMGDLWDRIALFVSPQRFGSVSDSLFGYYSGELRYDMVCREIKERLDMDVNHVIESWLVAKHESCFRVKDAIARYHPSVRLCVVSGKIINDGKEGGIVSVECGVFKKSQRYVDFLNAGEAKEFEIVTDVNPVNIKTSLSANRPQYFDFVYASGTDDKELVSGCAWTTISPLEFEPDKNEIVVDDVDTGFRVEDGTLTLFHKWIKRNTASREELRMMNADVPYWTSVIEINAYGDSIRSCHCKSGGTGRSRAVWHVVLPRAGKYNIMVKVYRESLLSSAFQKPRNVVYYYTVICGEKETCVDVYLDEVLKREGQVTDWASLGEFDFPAGEVSVTLSDKEVQGRKDVAIIADAVKWVKIE